jgi:hypothetical protein
LGRKRRADAFAVTIHARIGAVDELNLDALDHDVPISGDLRQCRSAVNDDVYRGFRF